jgi:hypothetical protein
MEQRLDFGFSLGNRCFNFYVGKQDMEKSQIIGN